MGSLIKRVLFILSFSILQLSLIAQDIRDINGDQTGYLSLGARNSLGMFRTNGKSFTGTGAGGQFGIRIAKDFNSHYFADWITSNIDNVAQRNDFHSGFSMMPQLFTPKLANSHVEIFPLAGICIDYTKFSITSGNNYLNGPKWLERYSFAVQAGFGGTLPVSKDLDFTMDAHYMLHIGTDVEIERN